jgi:hypothetical protein
MQFLVRHGRPPDLDRWRALQMPDLVVVERLRST